MKPRLWSQDEERRLCEAVERGEPATDIARAIGRTKVAIEVHKRKLGLRTNRQPRPIAAQTKKPENRKPRAIAEEEMQRKNKQPRSCLCCNAAFLSAGPHNRLCTVCRRRSVSPYAV